LNSSSCVFHRNRRCRFRILPVVLKKTKLPYPPCYPILIVYLHTMIIINSSPNWYDFQFCRFGCIIENVLKFKNLVLFRELLANCCLEEETWKHVIKSSLKLENYTRGQSQELLEFLALGRNTPIQLDVYVHMQDVPRYQVFKILPHYVQVFS
jgi:hypothetical protein